MSRRDLAPHPRPLGARRRIYRSPPSRRRRASRLCHSPPLPPPHRPPHLRRLPPPSPPNRPPRLRRSAWRWTVARRVHGQRTLCRVVAACAGRRAHVLRLRMPSIILRTSRNATTSASTSLRASAPPPPLLALLFRARSRQSQRGAFGKAALGRAALGVPSQMRALGSQGRAPVRRRSLAGAVAAVPLPPRTSRDRGCVHLPPPCANLPLVSPPSRVSHAPRSRIRSGRSPRASRLPKAGGCSPPLPTRTPRLARCEVPSRRQAMPESRTRQSPLRA